MDSHPPPSPPILFLVETQSEQFSPMITTPLNFPEPPNAHLIGHRGLPSMAPENSLKSFKLAAEAGLNWVEFDVQITQDNKLIIMHDDTIDRTTDGTGIVHELTLIKLQDLGIPTLAETMILLHDHKVNANIELKLPENLDENRLAPIRARLLTAFMDYLQSSWPKDKLDLEWPLVSSFDHPILIQLRALYPKLPLGFLVEEPKADDLALAKQFAPASINAKSEFITVEFMKLANQQNTPIYVYTVNQLDKAKELLEWGVHGIFTDVGNTLKVALEKNKMTQRS
jgi:glycerophosphoryl diester phosphodiesterase